jgi:hypothetical protein
VGADLRAATPTDRLPLVAAWGTGTQSSPPDLKTRGLKGQENPARGQRWDEHPERMIVPSVALGLSAKSTASPEGAEQSLSPAGVHLSCQTLCLPKIICFPIALLSELATLWHIKPGATRRLSAPACPGLDSLGLSGLAGYVDL